jgi:Zn-dependent alcohol dehydrogenase
MSREWLIDGKMDLSPLLSGNRRLEDVSEVFADLEAGRGLKYVFNP